MQLMLLNLCIERMYTFQSLSSIIFFVWSCDLNLSRGQKDPVKDLCGFYPGLLINLAKHQKQNHRSKQLPVQIQQ